MAQHRIASGAGIGVLYCVAGDVDDRLVRLFHFTVEHRQIFLADGAFRPQFQCAFQVFFSHRVIFGADVGGAEIVLRGRPVEGELLARVHGERRAMGRYRLSQMGRALFALGQGPKRGAQVVLGHGEMERKLVADVDFQRRLVGVDRLLEMPGSLLAAAQVGERRAQAVLGFRPVERPPETGHHLQRRAIGLDGVLQGGGSVLAFREHLQRIAEIDLGVGPVQRKTVAREHLQRRVEGFDRLLEPNGPAQAGAERAKPHAEFVLGHRPFHGQPVARKDLQRRPVGGDGVVKALRGLAVFAKGMTGGAQAALGHGPVQRQGSARQGFERGGMSRDRLVQGRRSFLALPQGSQGDTEIVLGHGPGHRQPLLGDDLQGSAVGRHRLSQMLGGLAAFAERPQRHRPVVFQHGPVHGHLGPRVDILGAAESREGLLEITGLLLQFAQHPQRVAQGVECHRPQIRRLDGVGLLQNHFQVGDGALQPFGIVGVLANGRRRRPMGGTNPRETARGQAAWRIVENPPGHRRGRNEQSQNALRLSLGRRVDPGQRHAVNDLSQTVFEVVGKFEHVAHRPKSANLSARRYRRREETEPDGPLAFRPFAPDQNVGPGVPRDRASGAQRLREVFDGIPRTFGAQRSVAALHDDLGVPLESGHHAQRLRLRRVVAGEVRDENLERGRLPGARAGEGGRRDRGRDLGQRDGGVRRAGRRIVDRGRTQLLEPEQRENPAAVVVEHPHVIGFVKIVLDRGEMAAVPGLGQLQGNLARDELGDALALELLQKSGVRRRFMRRQDHQGPPRRQQHDRLHTRYPPKGSY